MSTTDFVRDLNRGLCVNAGAGSGKTSLLVQRYLEILDQGKSEPERIVAITFTDKAATEMKSRIRIALEERQAAGQAPDKWKSALEAMGNARIGTIHWFCASILRQYPLEAGVDPQFRVLDGVAADLLLQKSLRAQWHKWMEGSHPSLLKALKFLDPRDLLDILEALLLQRATVAEYHANWAARGGKKFLMEALAQAKKSHPKDKDLQKLDWSVADDSSLQCAQLLLQLSDEFNAEFLRAKSQGNQLDFEDLQILALKLLGIGRIQDKIRGAIDQLLVDEFQDTNEIQRRIIYSIAPLSCQFIVGDPKQSIYRFRGADVSVFRRVQQDMPSLGRVIRMDTNYRSVPTILSFCNALFGRLMAESGRPYEILHEPLRPHRQENGMASRIAAWQHRIALADRPALNDLRRREAAHIASVLCGWMDKENPYPGFRWKDVGILFRSMNKVHLYERELAKAGIPFTTSSASAFYAQQCVTDMINALAAALNRSDELALAGFLRSPMAGVSDETLVGLRQQQGLSLWDAMRESHEPKLCKAREWLDQWHASLPWLSPADCMRRILADTDYEAILLAQYLGARKVALLGKMRELAGRFAPEEGCTLQDFLDYMKELVLEEKNESEGPPLEDADVVSLLTVHKAKGLEFPIVILADLAHEKRTQLSDVLIHEEFGLGIKWKDERDESVSTVARKLAELEERRKEEAESKRILYVACTRARDMLIFSGLVQPHSKINLWDKWILEFIHARSDKSDACSLQWIEGKPAGQPPGCRARTEKDSTLWKPEDWAAATMDLTPMANRLKRCTVSELEERIHPPSTQEFLLEGSNEGTRIGTLVHRVLSYWDRKNDKDLLALANSWGKETFFEESSARSATDKAKELIARFLASDFAQTLRRADPFYKEIPFVLPSAGPAGPMIEGTIDVLTKYPDGQWTVLDYKTNAISKAQVVQIAKDYELQIKLYGAAALQILGLSQIQLALHFLTPDFLWRETLTREQALYFQSRFCYFMAPQS